MKYFLDTEFMEQPGRLELISIGIVSEDGRELYAENSDADFDFANQWVRENVTKHLWVYQEDDPWKRFSDCGGFGGWRAISEIGKSVLSFVGNDSNPEFWGYYADYDWVVFCWLFGAMIDLPKGFPMYCRDIKQEMDRKGNPEKPKQESAEHNALSDAHYHKQLYDWISSYGDNINSIGLTKE